MTAVKCAAIASALMLTAGSAAWAQTYTTSPNTSGSYNQGTQGYSTTTPGTQGYSGYSSQGTQNTNQGNWGSNTTTPGSQGYSSQGTYNTNQGNWGSNANQGSGGTGMQGSSTPYGGQGYSHSGYGMGNVTTYQQAEQELTKYGYNNVRDLKAMQGWSADAMKNGERVHVIIGDNGLVATFPGK